MTEQSSTVPAADIRLSASQGWELVLSAKLQAQRNGVTKLLKFIRFERFFALLKMTGNKAFRKTKKKDKEKGRQNTFWHPLSLSNSPSRRRAIHYQMRARFSGAR